MSRRNWLSVGNLAKAMPSTVRVFKADCRNSLSCSPSRPLHVSSSSRSEAYDSGINTLETTGKLTPLAGATTEKPPPPLKRGRKGRKQIDRQKETLTTEITKQYQNNNHKTVIEARNLLQTVKDQINIDIMAERNKIADIEILINKMALRTTSLLGLSAEELKKRYDFLMTHEFSSILSLRLALEVPTLLSFDSPSSSRIIKLFKKYELGLYTFLVEPSVFSLDPDIVERNIMTLFDIGLSSSQISFLFCKYSACVALPMNQEALESVRKLSSTCNEESGSFINGIVKSSLGAITVKNDQGLEFEGAMSFLNEVKVPINIILGKYPEFFSYSSQHLWHCFDCLTNGPLFFDEEALKEYIENNPDIFVTVDQKPIQDLISKLRQLISDGNRLFALFIRKSKLFTKPSIVLQKISILEKWKFSDEQITKLLFQFHSLFSAERDNLNDRLKFLLGSGDLTTQGLVTLGICLTIRSSVMKWRIGFLREKNIEALSLFEGGDLMFSDEETFAVNICKSTFAEFDAYVKKHSHFEKYNYYLEKREVRNAQVIEKAKLDK